MQDGRTRSWPLGHEIYLACDVRVAAATTDFGQDENTHGRFPGGGATVRFVCEAGWGNAMRDPDQRHVLDAVNDRDVRVIQRGEQVRQTGPGASRRSSTRHRAAIVLPTLPDQQENISATLLVPDVEPSCLLLLARS